MKQIIDDLRDIAANPDVYEHDYPAIIRRIADRLEAAAATALVPVMVGEKIEARDLRFHCTFTCDHPGFWQLSNWSRLYIRNIHTGEESALTTDATVQPVRLVPALDAMEGE